MTLKLDKPIIEWQENRPDNKPHITEGLSSSGLVWFVVKLTKEHLCGRYSNHYNKWLRSGDKIFTDDEVGWFIELPISTFDHIPQEFECLLTSDIVGPDPTDDINDWALIADFAYTYQNIIPHHHLEDGNYGFHEWLIEGCSELQKVEFTFDHEHSCAYYFFEVEEQAFKFIGIVNEFLEEQFKLGA